MYKLFKKNLYWILLKSNIISFEPWLVSVNIYQFFCLLEYMSFLFFYLIIFFKRITSEHKTKEEEEKILLA